MMMHRPRPADEPSAGNETQFPDLLETLESLVDDLESFLSDWMLSAEHATILSEAAAAPEHALRKRIHAFEMQKRQWELARKHEAKLARQRCEELTEAWLQLEAEQQRFSQLKQLSPPMAAAAARGEFRGEFAEGPDPITRATTANERKGGGAAPAAPARLSGSVPSTAAAVQQFQRLRREIDASGPRPAKS
jgi:hypothetical protein